MKTLLALTLLLLCGCTGGKREHISSAPPETWSPEHVVQLASAALRERGIESLGNAIWGIQPDPDGWTVTVHNLEGNYQPQPTFMLRRRFLRDSARFRMSREGWISDFTYGIWEGPQPADAGDGNMLWTKRDSWYTGFPSQPPWCDKEQHQIHKQRIVPVPDAQLEEASALLAGASAVEIDLAAAQELTGIPDLNPDALLHAAIAETTAKADKREKEAQDPFFATHAELFREEVQEQRAAASQAEALLGKLKPYLVRAVVLWEGTGAFSAYWKESALWIHHGCLGASAAPMKRRPLVVFLEKKPVAAFNGVSMAK